MGSDRFLEQQSEANANYSRVVAENAKLQERVMALERTIRTLEDQLEYERGVACEMAYFYSE